jgi:hypothetical protein
MLVGPRHKRPAIAHLGVSVVDFGSGEHIPIRPDETPEHREAELQATPEAIMHAVEEIFTQPT